MRVVVRRLSDGERAPMLLDEQGLPIAWPTLFATVRMRNAMERPSPLLPPVINTILSLKSVIFYPVILFCSWFLTVKYKFSIPVLRHINSTML